MPGRARHIKTRGLMTDRYAVVGNPIAHSKSPIIHAEFARQTGQDLVYERLLAPVDGFRATVNAFRAEGGRGLNVTIPFKLEAFDYADKRSVRAERAGAVNVLSFFAHEVVADNTDGAGLIRDLEANLRITLRGKRVLLLGAGGAAQGVMHPLLEREPVVLVIANRTVEKARTLATRFAALGHVSASSYAALKGTAFDLIINATAASLAGKLPPLPEGVFAKQSLAYDMMYGRGETPFMAFAKAHGAAACADGLGMLVEQAAEAFYVWRGIRPSTEKVLRHLRDLS